MLLVLFDPEGIVHHEDAPDGQKINKKFYLEVLRRLRDSVRLKRPEKWRNGDWILHHDNRPAHTLHLGSSRHAHQISHRVTFFYSQRLRKF